jgi:hypothetical protein
MPSRTRQLPFAAALVALLCALALASPAGAIEQKISVTGDDLLGAAVAVQGDTLVLGAPFAADNAGAAYVFRRAGDSWTQTATLTASDAAKDGSFGSSVAIDGDTIVVGSPLTGAGAVYTFARTGAPERTQAAKLTASDGAKDDRFGQSVAIDGDTIVVGAPSDAIGGNVGQGSAYTFAATGAPARTETAKLTASDGARTDQLGTSVAVDGDTIVAGARRAANDVGAAYTFARAGAAARTETAKLTASDGVPGAGLGFSVAIDGDTIAAGAPDAVFGGVEQGAVYTFTRAGAAARTESAVLTASNGVAGDALGWSVAVAGDAIVAGATGVDDSRGAAYTFARTGAPNRTQTGELADADGAIDDLLGYSVAVDGGTIVLGAPRRNSASIFFAPTPLPPPAVTALAPSLAPRVAKPALSRLAVDRKRARITFTLSVAARVELRFERARCAKPSRSNRAKRPCTRYVKVGSFTVRGKAGANAVRFTGRLPGHRPLAAGRYRLTATPTSAGIHGTARRTTLTITRRTPRGARR